MEEISGHLKDADLNGLVSFDVAHYPGGAVLQVSYENLSYVKKGPMIFPHVGKSQIGQMAMWQVSACSMTEFPSKPHIKVWDDGNNERRVEDPAQIAAAICKEILELDAQV